MYLLKNTSTANNSQVRCLNNLRKVDTETQFSEQTISITVDCFLPWTGGIIWNSLQWLKFWSLYSHKQTTRGEGAPPIPQDQDYLGRNGHVVISGMTHPHQVSHEKHWLRTREAAHHRASCFEESMLSDSSEWMKGTVSGGREGGRVMSREIRGKRASIKHAETVS